ncbi:phosphoenolpyruvate carboxylase [Ignisphaera sp. 4213-co]|uniref:Phosphoenolpyruvate carboxylase n=1 Tax=Ignisphaera cupida TaxID=3050454 RepID=A0ABD4Z989_9CREN|nr:phosphoenolpyruvate carboxylase [Ignisphaera sp. 4213-co]MDK6029133.1 phosphoenolpyruvate carboxylase [Ignisphaera sp. 4213-co]
MEFIPRFMCTQHPDASVKITAQEEVDEAIQGYTMYGCDEVMSDYEGKLTPYAQPKDIVVKAAKLGIPIGDKYFITPRIPNPKLEDIDRVALSIEASLIANYYSHQHLNTQAVKWIIMPMVEDPNNVRLIQKLIIKKARILQEELGLPKNDIQLIPLVEDTQRFLEIHRYVTILYNTVKEFGVDINHLRVFLGKSDAAVKTGHVASALGLMYALNELRKIDEELDLDIQPIIGMGSPSFRGGINNPNLVEYEVKHYQGYSTVTIQSAIRYDVPFAEYRKVFSSIMQWLGKKPHEVSASVLRIIRSASESYRKTVARYLEVLVKYASYIPSTRDRVTWKEYGRIFPAEDKTLNVPRAIVYTATWYILGLPPIYLDAEFIANAYRSNEIDEILNYMPYLIDEWEYESQFYIPTIARQRLDEAIVKKVNEVLDYMGIKPEPNETYKSILEFNPIEPQVVALAKIRGFLG